MILDDYLKDLTHEILRLGREAKCRAAAGDLFEKGRQMGFYEVLSLMKNQAAAFGFDAASIGVGGLDLEREIL